MKNYKFYHGWSKKNENGGQKVKKQIPSCISFVEKKSSKISERRHCSALTRTSASNISTNLKPEEKLPSLYGCLFKFFKCPFHRDIFLNLELLNKFFKKKLEGEVFSPYGCLSEFFKLRLNRDFILDLELFVKFAQKKLEKE